MNMTSKKNNTGFARLRQDYMRIKRDPVPYITAEPLPSNIFEWHYVVKGPESSPHEGGFYHGKLVFPREFPFKPPSIYMITPNGRFKCNTRLCLSISDFHPDTWNPAWSVSTILTGLLSFMLEKSPTLGSIETSDITKRQLALQSSAFNVKNQVFCELFPEITTEIQQELSRRQAEMAQVGQSQVSQTRGAQSNQNALQPENGNQQGLLSSTLTNLVVIVGFAAFAYTVKYVLRSIVE